MTVIELKTRPRQVIDSVVMRLEEALKEAREGKITAVAIAAVDSEGALLTMWSETDDFGRLLGAIARLEYRVNDTQPITETNE